MKRLASYRLSESSRRLLEQMAKERSVSRTVALELLIQDAARKGGLPLFREPLPADDRR